MGLVQKVSVGLFAQEPVEARIGVLVGALREHCAEFLESRYLSPAVRDRLDAEEAN